MVDALYREFRAEAEAAQEALEMPETALGSQDVASSVDGGSKAGEAQQEAAEEELTFEQLLTLSHQELKSLCRHYNVPASEEQVVLREAALPLLGEGRGRSCPAGGCYLSSIVFALFVDGTKSELAQRLLERVWEESSPQPSPDLAQQQEQPVAVPAAAAAPEVIALSASALLDLQPAKLSLKELRDIAPRFGISADGSRPVLLEKIQAYIAVSQLPDAPLVVRPAHLSLWIDPLDCIVGAGRKDGSPPSAGAAQDRDRVGSKVAPGARQPGRQRGVERAGNPWDASQGGQQGLGPFRAGSAARGESRCSAAAAAATASAGPTGLCRRALGLRDPRPSSFLLFRTSSPMDRRAVSRTQSGR